MLPYITNNVADGVLVMQGAMASAAVVLTQIIWVPHDKG